MNFSSIISLSAASGSSLAQASRSPFLPSARRGAADVFFGETNVPDRMLRDELLDSERWLDLPSDTHRVVYVGLLLRADDFGNLEGGPRRLFRFMHGFTQVKTELAAIARMGALVDADLARRYEVDGRELWHLPRTRSWSRKSYLVRKVPASPWCPPDRELGKHVRSIRNQGHAEKVNVTSVSRELNVWLGVGVGVGVEKIKNKSKAKASAQAPFVLPDWIPQEHWDAWVEARTKARKPPTDYAKRLAVMRLNNFREQGYSVGEILRESAMNNWANLFLPKER